MKLKDPILNENQRTNSLRTIHFLDPSPENSQTVMLLHGLGSTSVSWQMQMNELMQKKFRPIAPDIPGFGKSKRFDGRWTVSSAAQNLVEMMNELGEESFAVVGFSMGGAVALQIVLDFPEKINKLVLVNTFAALRPRDLDEAWYFVRRFVKASLLGAEAQAELVAHRVFPHPEKEDYRNVVVKQILEADRNTYNQAMRSLGRFNVLSRLKEISIPTLVITGERDTTISAHTQEKLVCSIAGAQQVFIPDAGHAAMIDQPELFNRALISFLDRNDL